MTCKVVRLIDRDRLVQIFISGHLQEVHINMINDLLTQETDPVALDLGEVTLVDRDAIKYLADCEADGTKLENCPPYVRKWIGQERGRPRRKKRNGHIDTRQKRSKANELE